MICIANLRGGDAIQVQRVILKQIVHDGGFAYRARTWHPELSSHCHPSSAVVLEDGVPLAGPANALHDDIRHIGMGRYSFWYSTVYFSASDNSDPRANGRVYVVEFVSSSLVKSLLAFLPFYCALARAREYLRLVQASERDLILWGMLYALSFLYVAALNWSAAKLSSISEQLRRKS